MINLSPHFTVAEFVTSQTASRLNIDNTPPPDVLEKMQRTAQMLEKVRVFLNANAIHVSSGYRCPALNTAVGSKSTSQHCTGEAVDFTCPTFGNPERLMAYIAGSNIVFDQCILEFNSWIHMSYSDYNRNQLLVIDSHGTRVYS